MRSRFSHHVGFLPSSDKCFFPDAVLAYLSVETSSLDDFDLLQTIQSLEKPAASYPPIDFLQFMACYETLLYTPLEYLSKNVRADLLRRGLSADVLLTRLLHSSNEHDKSKFWQMKTILREFSNRLFSYLNAVEYPVSSIIMRCQSTEHFYFRLLMR